MTTFVHLCFPTNHDCYILYDRVVHFYWSLITRLRLASYKAGYAERDIYRTVIKGVNLVYFRGYVSGF